MQGLGPRLLKPAITQLLVFVARAPVPQASGPLAGVPTVPAPGPSLPFEKAGKMPAFTQLVTAASYELSQPGRPNCCWILEVAGRGEDRSQLPTRVGASVHWKPRMMASP